MYFRKKLFKIYLLLLGILLSFCIILLFNNNYYYFTTSIPNFKLGKRFSSTICGKYDDSMFPSKINRTLEESTKNLKYSINEEKMVDGFPPLPGWKIHLYQQSNYSSIFGKVIIGKKFLTIGISTVYRSEKYLKTTLQSLINEADIEEQEMFIILIYLADTDLENRDLQLKLIEDNFGSYLESGLIQIITSTPDIYPPLDFALTKRTYNDSVDRVIWRSKQVIDFAFLFSYITNHQMSDYYVIAEDDIIATTKYITAIQEYIILKNSKSVKWTALQFSTFVGIGLLFHLKDLVRLTQFLLMFYQNQPVDVLMRKFIHLQNPTKSADESILNRIPAIFQHIGKSSTLPNKIQSWSDSSFNIAQRKFKNKNPVPMKITSTMKVYSDFEPSNAYSSAPGWFLGIPTKSNETFDIVYSQPINVSRIVFITGLPERTLRLKNFHKGGIILNGSLQISSDFEPSLGICTNFTTVGVFDESGVVDVKYEIDGQSYTDYNNDSSSTVIRCIRVVIRQTVEYFWVLIREIEVFSA